MNKEPKRHILLKFLDTTTVTLLTLFILCILSSPERHWFHAGFGLVVMYFWVYLIHRGIHALPKTGVFEYINTHYLFHHQPLKLLNRRVELLLETVTDMGMSLSLLALQWATGVWFVPTSVILFYAFTYTSTHIFNYSILGSETHRNHHKNMETNFGPDTFDHLFGTNYDDTMEDLMPIALNGICAFVVVYALKQYIQWKD